MNVEEFISSGILESYLLGTATPEEIRQVQEMEKAHPRVKEELDLIESQLIGMAEENAGSPSKAAESRIRATLFSSPAKVVPISASSSSSRLKFAAAAAAVLLLGSLVTNYILYSRLDRSEKELAAINNERSVIASQMNVQQASLKNMGEQLNMMMDPSNKMVALKGMDLSPSSSALVLWNQRSKAVFIHIASLPAPPAGKQYQLWALVDGKPVDAGVFNVGEQADAIQKMKEMPQAQAFAVTLENAGGSPVPTMEAMYLIGNV